MAAQKNAIELLPQEDWEKGNLGKIIKWTLTIGRYIVIVTELIVILVFLSRFKFDREATDLDEATKKKQAIIASYADFEDKFRLMQYRLDTIQQLRSQRLDANQALSSLAALIPVDVYLQGLTVNDKTIALSATALSESGLATLIYNLKNSGIFSKITLSQITISAQRDTGIMFQITAEKLSSPKKI